MQANQIDPIYTQVYENTQIYEKIKKRYPIIYDIPKETKYRSDLELLIQTGSYDEIYNKIRSKYSVINTECLDIALKNGKKQHVKAFIDKRTKLSKKSLVYALISENEDIIKMIYEKQTTYSNSVLDFLNENGFDESINIIKNLELKEIIEKDKTLTNHAILKYIKHKDFVPHYSVLYELTDEILVPIILSYLITERYNDIIDLFNNFTNYAYIFTHHDDLTDEFIKLLATLIFGRKNIEQKYCVLELLHKENILDRFENDIIKFILQNIPFNQTGIMLNNSEICVNVEMCKKFKNTSSLGGINWSDVFSDDECNVVYKSEDNHGFIISELLRSWETGLSSFNYTIKAKYPRNPYNNKYIHPMELYRIIYYAAVYKIKLPLIMGYFIKNPYTLCKCYTDILANENNCDNIMQYELEGLRLTYGGGDASENEAGEWRLNKNEFKDDEYKYFVNDIMIPVVANMLLLRVHILLATSKKDKRVVDIDNQFLCI